MKIWISTLNYVMMSLCFLLMSGCVEHGYNLVQSDLSWEEFQEHEVSFGNPGWNAGQLTIPFTSIPKTGDSLHVMSFKTRVEKDTIFVTGRPKTPDKNQEQRNHIIVSLPDPVSDRYRIVYENPNGTVKYIQDLEIPDK